MSVRTCRPYDPESKGGSEATVKIAKADIVPTETNLLPAYRTFEDLRQACRDFMQTVNNRPHKEIKRAPSEMIVEERQKLHPVPEAPYAAAFGETRKVDKSDSTIRFGSGIRFPTPCRRMGVGFSKGR